MADLERLSCRAYAGARPELYFSWSQVSALETLIYSSRDPCRGFSRRKRATVFVPRVAADDN